jgi:D-alanyl-lipoteichoic acid acyltransferase DltB (MBOAT superfamily)
MLFNSYVFLLAFLPLTLAAFAGFSRISQAAGATVLAIASCVFYGWWNPHNLIVLAASITFNYFVGGACSRAVASGMQQRARALLTLGVVGDLGALAYFKYAAFLVENANTLAGTSLTVGHIELPIGISFFTFTQIAFLADAYKGKAREYNPIHYALFVTYFPHLVAGPILHHKEMMPQFESPAVYRLRGANLAVGLSIFSIGLFKKTVLADSIAPHANTVFSSAASGASVDFFDAWGGALSYTFQLYFDFSGYSDMAIGLSRLFGVQLPLNFDSPYKATSISDFWRRWHMTLSRFLRDYLYIPLGGNRKGPIRRYANLAITMLLGGLWHGAGWTFVIWGGLHGLYLVVNHAWRGAMSALGIQGTVRAYGVVMGAVTFLAVVVAWVFFRAPDAGTAWRVLQGMAGLNGVALPVAYTSLLGPVAAVLEGLGVQFKLGGGAQFMSMYLWIVVLGGIAFLFPNTQELMREHEPALDYASPYSGRIRWSPSGAWGVVIAALAACGVLSLARQSEFLYFQF